MASLKTQILIKLMLFYNYIIEKYNKYKNAIFNLYTYLADYYEGTNECWLFIPGHSTPVPITNINNEVSAIWLYNNNKLELETFRECDEKFKVKFSWLSANIRILTQHYDKMYKYEFNIDDFLEKFRVVTSMDSVPTLLTIFLTWCCHTKYWFTENSFIEFVIIDEDGEEGILTIENDNECLVIKHNKIYVVVHSDEDEKTTITIESMPQSQQVSPEIKPQSNHSSPELKPIAQVDKNKDD